MRNNNVLLYLITGLLVVIIAAYIFRGSQVESDTPEARERGADIVPK